MSSNKRETKRKRVYFYYVKFKHLGFRVNDGGPVKISYKKAKKELKRLVNNKNGASQRKPASRFQCYRKQKISFKKSK